MLMYTAAVYLCTHKSTYMMYMYNICMYRVEIQYGNKASIHLFIYSFIHLFIYYLFIYLFIYSFIHIYLCVHGATCVRFVYTYLYTCTYII